MFNFQSSLGAWIKRIVINACIDHLRKRKLVFLEVEEEKMNIPTEEVGPVETKVDVKKIQSAMDQLADGYRVIFSLFAVEGYDHQEISQIMGISESTSKTQYHRAKKKMYQFLQADYQAGRLYEEK